MSNWVVLTEDMVRATGYGPVIDRARSQQGVGAVDPLSQAITSITGRIRRTVSSGNQLDAVTTKIPGSLQDIALRAVFFALCDLISLPLNDDQKKKQTADDAELQRINKDKVKVDEPDTPAANAEQQSSGVFAEATNFPRRQTRRDQLSGL